MLAEDLMAVSTRAPLTLPFDNPSIELPALSGPGDYRAGNPDGWIGPERGKLGVIWPPADFIDAARSGNQVLYLQVDNASASPSSAQLIPHPITAGKTYTLKFSHATRKDILFPGSLTVSLRSQTSGIGVSTVFFAGPQNVWIDGDLSFIASSQQAGETLIAEFYVAAGETHGQALIDAISVIET